MYSRYRGLLQIDCFVIRGKRLNEITVNSDQKHEPVFSLITKRLNKLIVNTNKICLPKRKKKINTFN